ncbi:MAG: LysE family translocator [Desulfobacterales bacterium]|nr:LysE family translocator [Deltaproteobacteria bacterium]MBT8360078.1 LysE family translocator [Deltaproteobacteria bacterium]NNK93588.1 LysE family translocator [Desulfobacterales bacterium]
MDEMQLALFVIASFIIIITPGQDLLLVMSRAVTQGSRAGIITASGVSIGLIGHSVLTAFGLGALLLASKSIFTILKFVGAGYLFYLGIRLITSKSHRLDLKSSQKVSPRKLFFTGAFSNISNPNITIFYFAFLPQFIPGNAENPTLQLLILGLFFAFLTFLVKGPVGYFAGILSLWLRSNPKILKWIDRTSGTVLIGLGIKLVFEQPP